MVDIGSLRLNLESDSRNFVGPLSDAEDAVEGLEGSLGDLGETAQRLGSFLSSPSGILSGVGAIGAAIVTSTAQLARYHQQLELGAGIAGITASEYEALGRALGVFGVDVDTVGDIMNDLQERLQDAREGTASFVDGLDRVGLSLSDFDGRTPTDQLFLFLGALERVDAQSQQLTANDFFGDAGQRVLSILRQVGGTRFQELVQEFRALDMTTDSVSRNLQLLNERYELLLARGQELGERFIVNLFTLGTAEVRAYTQAIQEANAERQRLFEQVGFDAIASLGLPDVEVSAARSREILSEAGEALLASFEDSETAARRIAQILQRVSARGVDRLPVDIGPPEPAAGAGLEDIEVSTAEAERALARFGRDALRQFQEQQREKDALEAAANQLRISRAQAWGSAINTITAAAIADTENWGEVLLGVLAQILTQAAASQGGFASFFGGSQQFGGAITRSGSYIVGDAGPERVFLPRGSYVDSVTGDQFTFNISSSNPQETVDLLDQRVLPQLRRLVGNEVARREQRGLR